MNSSLFNGIKKTYSINKTLNFATEGPLINIENSQKDITAHQNKKVDPEIIDSIEIFLDSQEKEVELQKQKVISQKLKNRHLTMKVKIALQHLAIIGPSGILVYIEENQFSEKSKSMDTRVDQWTEYLTNDISGQIVFESIVSKNKMWGSTPKEIANKISQMDLMFCSLYSRYFISDDDFSDVNIQYINMLSCFGEVFNFSLIAAE